MSLPFITPFILLAPDNSSLRVLTLIGSVNSTLLAPEASSASSVVKVT
jgi:hypothetical protein